MMKIGWMDLWKKFWGSPEVRYGFRVLVIILVIASPLIWIHPDRFVLMLYISPLVWAYLTGIAYLHGGLSKSKEDGAD